MVHFVNDKCIKCKYTDCVEVCPVDCFHEADEMLLIDPEVCIDCEVCVPECPIDAIVNDSTFVDGKSIEDILNTENNKLTKEQKDAKIMRDYNEKNAQKLPAITNRKKPLPEAEKFKDKSGKIIYIKNGSA